MDEARNATPAELVCLYRPAKERDGLRRLAVAGLRIVEAYQVGEQVAIRFESDEFGLHLCFLSPEAEAQVRELAEAVSFLPKVSWRLPHTDMLLSGIRSGKWQGLALQDPRGDQLVSYLDFTRRDPPRKSRSILHDAPPVAPAACDPPACHPPPPLLDYPSGFDAREQPSHEPCSPAFRLLRLLTTATRSINGETTLYLTRKEWQTFSLSNQIDLAFDLNHYGVQSNA